MMASQYFVGLDLVAPRPRVRPDHPGLHQGRRDPDAGADDDLRDADPESGRRSPRGRWWPCSSARSPCVCLLSLHPDVAPIVAQLGEAEEPARTSCSWRSAWRWRSTARSSSTACAPSCTRPASSASTGWCAKLGEGGMGEVYLAEHQLLKRPCALKLIKPEAGSDPIALARFEREVQSAARLSHPNTIEIYDYGHTDDGTFYYVMEYLQGLSLSELVRRAGPLPPGGVIYLFRQVCAGLAEAHAPGPGPSGPEAGQRVRRGARRRVGRRQGARLRAGQADPGPGRRRATSSEMTVSGTPHVHGARAGDGRPLARRPRRHLRPGRDDVLRPDRPAAVHGRERRSP